MKAMPRISSKHQATLPVESLAAPNLVGALGVFDGLYGPDYLERLRSEERA
jgi:hypothetical protein